MTLIYVKLVNFDKCTRLVFICSIFLKGHHHQRLLVLLVALKLILVGLIMRERHCCKVSYHPDDFLSAIIFVDNHLIGNYFIRAGLRLAKV